MIHNMFFHFREVSKWMVAAAAIGVALIAALPTVSAADSEWQSEFFNNKTLSGEPLIRASEKNIDEDWGDGRPYEGLNKDAFSVRWKRTANFNTSGVYRFTATTDDGMRVWLDDTKIIDAWYDSQVHTVTADVYVSAGDHRLKVEYYEAGGKAVAKFNWTLLSASPPAPGTGNLLTWRGEYFNNTNLSGKPVLIRDDSQVNFDWGVKSPGSGVDSDNFSVRWSRVLALNSGKYRFTTTADDGVRLWVNGVLLIDQWKDQAATTTSVEVTLAGGNIPVVMEYYDHNGGAVAKLGFTQLSGTPTPPQPTGIWHAEYFNNEKLSGTPLSTRTEHAIDFNWGYGSPVPNVINVDKFSARWTANLNLGAGRYRFTATSDDGIRVYVNNRLLIDNWSDHAVQTVSADIDLPGGNIPVKVEYYDKSLLAEARLSWAPIGGGQPSSPPVTGNTAQVIASFLNVRTGPGVSNRAFMKLPYDTKITLVGYREIVGRSTWVMVETSSGRRGWVNAAYLRTSADISRFPLWEG